MTQRITIDPKTVSNVYTGKPGCMCGCNGNYRYAADWVVEGGLNRGYAVDPEDVSDRSIKIITGKLEKYINGLTQAQYDAAVKADGITVNSQLVFANINGRCLAAYFKNHEKAENDKAKAAKKSTQKFIETIGG